MCIYQALPKIKPAAIAKVPPTKENKATNRNCLHRFTNKIFIKSETKVEKVLRLPKKPTQPNKNNGDRLLTEVKLETENCKAKKNQEEKWLRYSQQMFPNT